MAGKIAVESEPGSGTVFRVYLPSRRGRGVKATILVVEDEEKLRRVIELQLKSAGFEVLQAAQRGGRACGSATRPI